jgi:hypothetical protein
MLAASTAMRPTPARRWSGGPKATEGESALSVRYRHDTGRGADRRSGRVPATTLTRHRTRPTRPDQVSVSDRITWRHPHRQLKADDRAGHHRVAAAVERDRDLLHALRRT